MVDITLCQAPTRGIDDCPLRGSCHRHTATPNELYQAFFVQAPYAEGWCVYFGGCREAAEAGEAKVGG